MTSLPIQLTAGPALGSARIGHDRMPAPAIIGRAGTVSSADAYARYGGLGLTTSQSQVLALMSEGFTNAEIAVELGITQDQASHRVHDVLSVLRARRHQSALAS